MVLIFMFFLGNIFFVQLSNVIGHSGYLIPGMPPWFPILNPKYHDNHHYFVNVNYAAMYTFTDRMFGTLRI